MKTKLLLIVFAILCVNLSAQQKKKSITKKPTSTKNQGNNVEGYENRRISTGDFDCTNITPKYDYGIETELSIRNIGNTDLVTKLMNNDEDVAYRIVYIRPNETINIKNIPEGNYYLKHAAGNEWYQKIENEKCIGIFKFEHGYYKDEDLMDFHIQRTEKTNGTSISIPVYQLNAGVVITQDQRVESNRISSTEFNE